MTISSRRDDLTQPTSGGDQVEQHPLPTSVALHLLPGIVTAAVFYTGLLRR